MYDRKIIYLHRYEGETDKGNAGYIKQERRDSTCSFLVVLMNLPPEYERDTELQVFPSGQALCKVHINVGQGHGMALYEEKQLEDMGIRYDEISSYNILVKDIVCLKGALSVPKCAKEEVLPVMDNKERSYEKSEIEPAWAEPERPYKNKWDQLSSGRERINFKGRESDYVKISPKDMIALSNPYHSLVNNAFLLHGYYNYKHLILGPSKGNRSTFFIGVPGNFYKQEVNAARMFGFEYFENGGEKVEVGDFGYYMKKVKL